MTIGQFPHCDSRILHAPGECEYCDGHPEWQELRQAWNIAFTGHAPVTSHNSVQLPCPADVARPPGSSADHRRWGGNTATGHRGDPSMPKQTAASVMMYGDQGARAQWPLPERLKNRLITYPLERLRMRYNVYVRKGNFWIRRG